MELRCKGIDKEFTQRVEQKFNEIFINDGLGKIKVAVADTDEQAEELIRNAVSQLAIMDVGTIFTADEVTANIDECIADIKSSGVVEINYVVQVADECTDDNEDSIESDTEANEILADELRSFIFISRKFFGSDENIQNILIYRLCYILSMLALDEYNETLELEEDDLATLCLILTEHSARLLYIALNEDVDTDEMIKNTIKKSGIESIRNVLYEVIGISYNRFKDYRTLAQYLAIQLSALYGCGTTARELGLYFSSIEEFRKAGMAEHAEAIGKIQELLDNIEKDTRDFVDSVEERGEISLDWIDEAAEKLEELMGENKRLHAEINEVHKALGRDTTKLIDYLNSLEELAEESEENKERNEENKEDETLNSDSEAVPIDENSIVKVEFKFQEIDNDGCKLDGAVETYSINLQEETSDTEDKVEDESE